MERLNLTNNLPGCNFKWCPGFCFPKASGYWQEVFGNIWRPPANCRKLSVSSQCPPAICRKVSVSHQSPPHATGRSRYHLNVPLHAAGRSRYRM